MSGSPSDAAPGLTSGASDGGGPGDGTGRGNARGGHEGLGSSMTGNFTLFGVPADNMTQEQQGRQYQANTALIQSANTVRQTSASATRFKVEANAMVLASLDSAGNIVPVDIRIRPGAIANIAGMNDRAVAGCANNRADLEDMLLMGANYVDTANRGYNFRVWKNPDEVPENDQAINLGHQDRNEQGADVGPSNASGFNDASGLGNPSRATVARQSSQPSRRNQRRQIQQEARRKQADEATAEGTQLPTKEDAAMGSSDLTATATTTTPESSSLEESMKALADSMKALANSTARFQEQMTHQMSQMVQQQVQQCLPPRLLMYSPSLLSQPIKPTLRSRCAL
ncbi:unnamed protein product [Clonostachys rosea]|uniref:Uncharacterized protein n=1 Tax=Bionectria ochroleuca TaxID=29856 RepID=A0ABY6U3C8_BIOOC|nr:unnamed protein product [Clonostachys rosea]